MGEVVHLVAGDSENYGAAREQLEQAGATMVAERRRDCVGGVARGLFRGVADKRPTYEQLAQFAAQMAQERDGAYRVAAQHQQRFEAAAEAGLRADAVAYRRLLWAFFWAACAAGTAILAMVGWMR